jgi:nitrous oxidase accessory protein NosD
MQRSWFSHPPTLAVLTGALLLIDLVTPVSAKTILVPGDYSTIQAAINAAEPGDLIQVGPGTFTENITLDQKSSLTIEGTGANQTILQGASDQKSGFLITKSKAITVRNFTITRTRRGIDAADTTDLLIENSAFAQNLRQGILLTRSVARLQKLQISETLPDKDGSNGVGLWLQDNASAQLSDSEIARNVLAGILVTLLSQLEIQNSKITETQPNPGPSARGRGIILDFLSKASIVKSTVENNTDIGIEVFNESDAEIVETQVTGTKAGRFNPGHGVKADVNSRVRLKQSRIAGNAGDGLRLDASPQSSVTNKSTGHAALEQTVLQENEGCAITVDPLVNLALGSENVLESRKGQLCSAISSLAAGNRRQLAFTTSATGEIRATASWIGAAQAAIRLYAAGQPTPVAEVKGAGPLSLVFKVEATASSRWKLEIENISQETAQVFVTVTYPLLNGTCQQIQSEFFVAAVSDPATRPFSAQECQMLYSVFKSLPPNVRGKVAQILRRPTDPEAAGRAESAFIQLYGELSRSQFMQTTFHEAAHVAHFKLFSPQQRSEWSQIHRRSGTDPENYIGDIFGTRLYGMTNEFEDFAELVEDYTQESARVIEVAKERAARGKTVLLEKVQFLVQILQNELKPNEVYVYQSQIRVAPDGSLRGTVRRVSVPLDAQGLPTIPADPEWEDF